MDRVRVRPGLEERPRGGEDERIPVLDVGIGVGYLKREFDPIDSPGAFLLVGRGRPGDEDRGSNGGSSEGAGRLVPAILEGEETSAGGGGGSASSGSSCMVFLF